MNRPALVSLDGTDDDVVAFTRRCEDTSNLSKNTSQILQRCVLSSASVANRKGYAGYENLGACTMQMPGVVSTAQETLALV